MGNRKGTFQKFMSTIKLIYLLTQTLKPDLAGIMNFTILAQTSLLILSMQFSSRFPFKTDDFKESVN